MQKKGRTVKKSGFSLIIYIFMFFLNYELQWNARKWGVNILIKPSLTHFFLKWVQLVFEDKVKQRIRKVVIHE